MTGMLVGKQLFQSINDYFESGHIAGQKLDSSILKLDFALLLCALFERFLNTSDHVESQFLRFDPSGEISVILYLSVYQVSIRNSSLIQFQL